MAKFTDEELAMLTEDERRAMEELGEEYDEDNEDPPMDPDDEDEAVEEESESDDDAADDDAGDDESEDDAGEDDQGDEGEAEDTEEGGEDESEGEGEDEQPEDEDEPAAKQPQPLLNAELPEGYEEKLTEIDTKRAELDTKFDDGDVDTKEYREALKALEKQESEIQQQVFKAQLAQEMRENQERQAWIDTVNDFLDDNPVYREKDVLYTALDAKVKAIANSEDGAKLTGKQILKQAHKDISEQLGIGQEAPKPEKEVEEKPKPKAKKRDVPPTLAKVPASDMTDTGEGGQFDKLDKLDGLELEKELSRLGKTNPRLVEDYLSR